MGRRFQLAIVILLIGLAFRSADAQCPGLWLAGSGQPGVTGGFPPNVRAVHSWDPDGDGPRPPLLVVGGDFDFAGVQRVNNIAVWDGSSWSALGDGLSGNRGGGGVVYALATFEGSLIAAGDITDSGGRPVNHVAIWNGSSWSTLGGGVNGGPADGVARALLVLPSGDLIVAGLFTLADGRSASNIARWAGQGWLPLGDGVSGGTSFPGVHALEVLANGDLVAAGQFTSAGGALARSIASWNGSQWAALGAGLHSGEQPGVVYDILTLPDGDLLAAGAFAEAGGAPAVNIARWNGAAWAAHAPGIDSGSVSALIRLADGDVVAGGRFTTGAGTPNRLVARWNGSAWAPFSIDIAGERVNALSLLPEGAIAVGGVFTRVGTPIANNIALWTGDSWSILGGGFDAPVRAIAVEPGGAVIAAGDFGRAGGTEAAHIARRGASGWTALGAGLNGPAHSIAFAPNGGFVVGGAFSRAGSVDAAGVARWDGARWSALGAGVVGAAYAVAFLPNGDLVAGGNFSFAGGAPASKVARWNGSAWLPLGSGMGSVEIVLALAVLPNADVVAAGSFTRAGGVLANNIARWDGSAWLPLGDGLSLSYGPTHVEALFVLESGDLVAAGSFDHAGGAPADDVARWDGQQWLRYPQLDALDHLRAINVLPSGDLVVGGSGSASRWDGARWLSLGGWSVRYGPPVRAIGVLPDGDVIAGGDFQTVGGIVSSYFATWLAPCPADVNCNRIVDSADFFAFLSAFLSAAPGADFNRDGAVNSVDFFEYLTAFFEGCS